MAKLTEKEEKFLAAYVDNGGKAIEAAETAGYAEKGITQTASRTKIKLQPEIESALKDKLKGMAPMAVGVLYDIAENGKTENARLAAANGILDRAGLKPVEQREELAPKRDRAALEAELAGMVGKELAAEFTSAANFEAAADFKALKEKAEAAKLEAESKVIVPTGETEKPQPAELAN